jgi:hypothetical protein
MWHALHLILACVFELNALPIGKLLDIVCDKDFAFIRFVAHPCCELHCRAKEIIFFLYRLTSIEANADTNRHRISTLLCVLSAAQISITDLTAFAADEKLAMMPSPVCFTSRP